MVLGELLSSSGAIVLVLWNFSKLLCDAQFSTECCQIAAISVLQHSSIACIVEFELTTVIFRDRWLTTLGSCMILSSYSVAACLCGMKSFNVHLDLVRMDYVRYLNLDEYLVF